VVLLAAGIYFYIGHQATAREEALAQALRVDDAAVGAQPSQGNLHFNTEAEKDAAYQKAFVDLASKYHGSQEGAIANMYLAQAAADKNNLDQSEKLYKDVADSAPKAYAAMAKMALVQIYESQGKDGEALKILNDLKANPAITVSKEEAMIEIARLESKKDLQKALTMLDGLKTERSAVSKAAMQAYADVSGMNLK
jgi:predicted negative regulator of RcsB-dependent stress response